MVESEIKILLVEDNDLDVIILQRMLRRLDLNHPIIRAKNGEEALAILKPGPQEVGIVPPFIMLVDINMPRMNGFELLDAIADDPLLSGVPTYIVSTSAREQDKQRAREYRIRGYVVKPVTEPVLMEILDESKAA